MQQKKVSINKCSIFHLLNASQNSREKLEAHLLDYMQKHPELTPAAPAAPPDEFLKIMDEFNKRGSKTKVRKQLKVLRYRAYVINFIQKPVMVIRKIFLNKICRMKRK